MTGRDSFTNCHTFSTTSSMESFRFRRRYRLSWIPLHLFDEAVLRMGLVQHGTAITQLPSKGCAHSEHSNVIFIKTGKHWVMQDRYPVTVSHTSSWPNFKIAGEPWKGRKTENSYCHNNLALCKLTETRSKHAE
jgi:hypothetical protein